jgi:hypothetical protein
VSGPKSFEISKHMVYEAYRRVKANKGAAGVDGQSIEQFEQDLKGNLYKLWNRMSSGCYFPPPVRMVELPKPGGKGVRVLGVPCVADRVAQTVAAMALEPQVEKIFHPDSYGYRPRKSALDAVQACRERCWQTAWVIDLDCHGKGRKQRITPLTAPAARTLRAWVTELPAHPGQILFPGRTGTRLSRDAVERRLTLHAATAAARCPSLAGKTISPHVLRHYVDGRVMWPAAASPPVAEPRVLVPAT